MQELDDLDWIGLDRERLPVEEAMAWATRPGCGAVVCFTGVVRDHSEGREGVSSLTYEAYEEQVVPKLKEVAADARRRWPEVDRIALLHRLGSLAVSEASVVVVVGSPHRPEAFEAARFCIDTLKETVPIWKAEQWEGGSDWAASDHPLRSL
ncbi:MAG: molybdenum cofactor biosynthesis protein MoaE [Actinomycetota bacterium]|nr:molybdenum cofactor biosynthesis protein MoaE [Actinomycetota bacterium]